MIGALAVGVAGTVALFAWGYKDYVGHRRVSATKKKHDLGKMTKIAMSSQTQRRAYFRLVLALLAVFWPPRILYP